MFQKKMSIAAIVIVILVSVATLVLAVWGALNYVSESRELRARLAAELNSSIRQLQAALVLPLWNFDRPQVEKVIESAMLDRDVFAVVVRQSDVSAPAGTVFHTRVRDSSGTITALDQDIPADGLLVQEIPVSASREVLGSVKLLISTKSVDAALRSNLFWLVVRIFTLDSFLIICLYLILRRTVLCPLKEVERYASIVSSGGKPSQQSSAPRYHGELQSLQSSIEKMIQMLDDRYAELRFNEEQFRLLFDKTIVGIVICEVIYDAAGLAHDFRLIKANPAFDQLTGLKRGEQIGRVYSELDWKWPEKLKQDLMGLAISGNHLRYDRFNDSLGRYYEVQAFSPKTGEFALIFNDITDRKRAEAVLLETEKMRTVAGLAAGMAHEINNPLAGMLQNAQVVLNRVTTDLPANRVAAEQCGIAVEAVNAYLTRRGIPEMLQNIRASGERAAEIVANMLSFSRKNDTQMETHVLADLLDRTLELATSDYDLKKEYDFKSIQVVREYAEQLLAVQCRASEIQQVVLNLLKNAAQAMAGKPNGHSPQITLRTAKLNSGVRIEVEDNGPGMPKGVSQRVFEPFFTTKDPHDGSGLGLFVSYFIITQNHHGTIAVASEPGRGTRFTIELPLMQDR